VPLKYKVKIQITILTTWLSTMVIGCPHTLTPGLPESPWPEGFLYSPQHYTKQQT